MLFNIAWFFRKRRLITFSAFWLFKYSLTDPTKNLKRLFAIQVEELSNPLKHWVAHDILFHFKLFEPENCWTNKSVANAAIFCGHSQNHQVWTARIRLVRWIGEDIWGTTNCLRAYWRPDLSHALSPSGTQLRDTWNLRRWDALLPLRGEGPACADKSE